MGFTEFLIDAGSNIIGEVVGGTIGEKLADRIIDKASELLKKRKAYNKFLGKNAANSSKQILDFFDDLNEEINSKASKKTSKDVKKAKNGEQRAKKLLSEFCLYSGITDDGIRQELSAYRTYNKIQDDELKQAIVDVLSAMREFYCVNNLSEDNKALIALLCSAVKAQGESVTDEIAQKVVEQLGGQVALINGNTSATLEDGGGVIVKSLAMTRLECPDCGNGILEELRSSKDKMFTCSNCGKQFSLADFNGDYKSEIDNRLFKIDDYLTAIYAEIKALQKQLTDVNSKEIADKVFNSTSAYFDDKILADKVDLEKYFEDNRGSLVKDISDVLESKLNIHDKNMVNSLRVQLVGKMCDPHIDSGRILELARDIKKFNLPLDYFANFCEETNNHHPDYKKIVRYFYDATENDLEDYGECITQFMLKAVYLLNDTTTPAFSAFIERAFISNEAKRSGYFGQLKQVLDKKEVNAYDIDLLDIDIFLAYSSADTLEAAKIRNELESQGIRCFFSAYNMYNGPHCSDRYIPDLKKALDKCKMIVFFSSNNSLSYDCEAVYKHATEFGELQYIMSDDISKAKAAGISTENYADIPNKYKKPRLRYILRTATKRNDYVNKFFGDQSNIYSVKDIISKFIDYVRNNQWSAIVGGQSTKDNVDYHEEEPAKPVKNGEGVKTQNLINLDDSDFHRADCGYVTFGMYPQSKKSMFVRIEGIYDEARGYYIGSDKHLYFGFKNKYYKLEPIRWQVLSSEEYLFLVAADILDAHRFDPSSNSYAWSEIKEFLNGEFYRMAFNDEQQNHIITAEVDNTKYSAGYNDDDTHGFTKDKVFLLSYYEVTKYLTQAKQCKRIPTAYAIARGAGLRCRWWLRSWRTIYTLHYEVVQYVRYNGKIMRDHHKHIRVGTVNSNNFGVVPAIKIKL